MRSFFSFVCGGRALWSDVPGSPIAEAEADHPGGWAGNRMEKRLKSGLESLNLTA